MDTPTHFTDQMMIEQQREMDETQKFLQSLIGAIVVVPSLKPRIAGYAPTPKGWEYKITEVDDLGPTSIGGRFVGMRAMAWRHNGENVVDRMRVPGLIVMTSYTHETTRKEALDRCAKNIAVRFDETQMRDLDVPDTSGRIWTVREDRTGVYKSSPSSVKVPFRKEFLADNFCIIDDDAWSIPRLIQLAKEANLQPFAIPLIHINVDISMNSARTMIDLVEHAYRIAHADLQYPIILSPLGTVLDGWHRIMRAILEEKETTLAVRFETMPPCDSAV